MAGLIIGRTFAQIRQNESAERLRVSSLVSDATPPQPYRVTAAERIIAHLGLQPLLPEGGYFARSWTAKETLADGRPAGTSIYFLLTAETFSAFHRLKADEVWHFYDGDPVEHWQWTADAPPVQKILGRDVIGGELPQLLIPAGTWQAARIHVSNKARGWALLGCTMSPGWRNEDFELLSRARLLAEAPPEFQSLADLTRT